ncbi:MAG TPA: monooxygenase, partial [Polyangiales bacterium]|nr:monooxygenase [Polyangiales bacterium]
SDEQKKTVLDWIKQGAPEGESEDEGEPLGDRVERALERVDIELKSPVGYKPQIEPDDYRCFVMEWPYEQTKYVTGINIAPDVTSQVHHAIIYHVQPENAQSARDRDAEDEGPGYTCFGATGGVSAWLQSYEPGGYAQGIPGNLGFEIKPGSVMILQVHYNTLNGIEVDQSKVEFTVEDSVPRVGKVVLIMNGFWPAGGMPIPANEPDVPFAYSGISSSIAQDRDYGIYWVDLHMHRLGRNGRIGIIRADKPAELEVLLDIPKWDFKWQETYLLHEPNVLHPGDQLYVECHFDNTTEKQAVVKGERLPVRDVNWGDATTDEMCLGNVLVSPLP